MIKNYSKVPGLFSSGHRVRRTGPPSPGSKMYLMRSLVALVIMLFGITNQVFAQSTANYNFSTNATGSLALDQNGNAVDMSTGTTQLVAASSDQGVSPVTNLGFDFYFMGNSFTQFSVSANGLLQLGATAVSGSTYVASGGSATSPRFSAFGGDLQTGSLGKVHYKVVGSAPNRCLVVEYLNMNLYYVSGVFANDATFQIRLYEKSGSIEYVYGSVSVSSAASGADVTPSIGFSAGTTTNLFSYVLYGTHTASTVAPFTDNPASVAGTVTSLNSTANGSRRTYLFVPPGNPGNTVATSIAAPSALTFTNVSAVGLTLNWAASSPATGVLKYLVFSSLDGVNYTFVNAVNVGTNTLAVTGLSPTTNYTFKVFAISEGVKSTDLIGSQTTTAVGSVNAIASGNWSDTATWSSGAVPNAGDNVTIPAGFTVTEDVTAAAAYSLTISGNLVYTAATARTLTVSTDVTINSGGTFKSAASGTVATHSLVVGGSLVNNGTLDFSAFTTSGATITFNGAGAANFNLGAASITNLRTVTLDKGTSITSVLTFTPGGTLTVQGANTAGFLAITNGLFKLDGTIAFSNPLFATAAYTIPATGGLWINNANATVTAQAGSPTFSGLFRLSGGTFNVGTATGNSVGFGGGSTTIIEGGVINAASRFGVGSSANTITYNQSSGVINVNQIGNASSTLASFDLGTSTTSTISITGGTVNIVLANTASSGPRDARGTSVAQPTITGGVVNFGTAASGAAKSYFFTGNLPSIVVSNTSAAHTASLNATASSFGNVTVASGATLNLNGYRFIARGTTFTNDGILTGTTTGSDLYFFSNAVAQTFTGTGVVTPGLTSLSADTGSQLIIDPAFSGITTLRVNLFTGSVVNSNKITLGTGAAVAAVVQIGAAGLTVPGGSFDVSPTWNLGTGSYSIIYQQESVARTTGFEVPPTRTATNVTVNNTNGVVLAGGAIDVSGTLTLTAGIVTSTDTNYLGLGSATAAGTLSGGSATSFVNGPLRRTFATRTATGTYSATTLFPVGKGTSYLPMYIDPTVTGAVVMSGEAFTANSGTQGGGVETLGTNRWEGLIKSGNANFTSSFIRLVDALTVSTNKILQASAGNGAYGSILPGTTFTAGTPNTITTASAINAADYLGYFSYGNLNICPAPTTQPANFVASNIGSTFFSGSFTAATGTPSHYLVVRYPATATPTDPVNYTAYTVGGTLGAGTVAAVLTAPTVSFAQTGLTAGTTYNYYVYAYNNSGCYGPVYNVATPLTASVTTCATAVTAPTALASSAVTPGGFTIAWTAGATNTLELDIATNNTFTTFVSGYSAKPLAAGTTSEVVTGLTPATTYYVRLRAIDGTCYSVNSSTLTVLTECNPEVAPTIVQTFADYTGNAPAPACWSEKTGALATNSVLTTSNSAWVNSAGFANVGSNVAAKINLYGTKNDWFISNPIDLGTTPKRLVYDMAVTSYNGTTAQTTLGSHKVDVVVSTDGGATWSNSNSVKSYTGVGTYSVTGQQQVVNLAAYSGVVKIAFVATTTSTSIDIDFHIDNFKVENFQAPTITNFSSTVACGDATVLTVTGTNLTGAVVTINGTAFTASSVSDTQLVIPVSVATNGNIVVTTPGGTATSATAFVFTTAPALTLSANSAAICSGSSSSIINVTSGAADYDTFAWSPATGVSGNATSGYTFNATASGVYTLTATQSAGTCSRTATFTLTVNAVPSALVVTPSSSTICEGSIVALNATGGANASTMLNETFDSNTTMPASLTAVAGTGDQIVIVNAQTAGGTGNQLRIVGNSQSTSVTDRVSAGPFNTAGMPSVTLSWKNYLNHYSSSYNYSVSIQTSTDGVTWHATSWSTSPVTAAQAASQQSVTISNNDVGSSTFYIAFIVSGQTFGMHNWNIDDVLLTGFAQGNVIWSPTADLYTDAAATVAYTGTAANTVYVKGSATTPASYTATVTNSSSCSTSATASITVTPNVVPDFAAIPAFCSGSTAPTLATTSPNGVTGTWSPATVSNTASGSYVFTPTAGQCATTQTLTVTVTTTAAPTGTSPQDYTTGETLADFDVTGTGIIWYDAPSGGNVLPASTVLVSNVTYYASQTVNGCESPTRLPITAGVNLKVDDFDSVSFKYYPNPVSNVLTVSYSQEITGLKLFNMVGQQLMTKKVNSTLTQLDMSHLPAGSYLLEVSSGSKSKVVKLLKNQ